jgi:hypothetical protein
VVKNFQYRSHKINLNIRKETKMRIRLKSAVNNRYVCAEDGGGRELIANRDVADIWEHFELSFMYSQPPLVNGSQISLRSYSGLYVCAEGGGGHELVANRHWNSGWETFKITTGNGGAINNGTSVYLQASNDQYVCAEDAGNGSLVANRNTPGPWETFVLEIDSASPMPTIKDFSVEVNWAGIVLILSHALTQKVLTATADAEKVKDILLGAASAAAVVISPPVSAAIAAAALYIKVERELIRFMDKGNGVYLTLPYPAIYAGVLGLIIPTSR